MKNNKEEDELLNFLMNQEEEGEKNSLNIMMKL